MSVEAKDHADYSARTMKRTIFLGLLAGTFLIPVAAQAQMYPGQGISVNPAAINGAGDGYTSPYARSGTSQVIHLHMPVAVVHHHRHVAAKPKPAASDVATAAPAETAPPPPASNSPYPPPLDSLTDTSTPPPAPVKHKHHAEAAAAPAAAPATDTTGADAALPLALDPQDEHPVSQPPKHKHADAAKTEKTASLDAAAPAATTIVPTHSSDVEKGMTRRSEILFPRGDPDVSSSTVDKMRAVAADLTTLLGAGASRVQLDAYGGAPGDKGSDARRLSLKRALGIRQLLIEDGVPSEKIDVRALGGIDDGGAPDRVDVLVRGG
jgi:outer membrane protein OmpA-like peptidoglycan-associated protein